MERIFKQLGEHDARIAGLESDREVLRSEHRQDLGRIFTKLDELSVAVESLKPSVEMNGIPERVRSLETWRNLLIGGGAVSWVVFAAVCIITYDWAKNHIVTFVSMLMTRLKS